MVRLLAGGIVVASLAIAAGPQLVRRVQTHAAFRIRVARALAALPLSFEANRGQTDSRVDYLAHGRGYTAFLTSNGSVVALARGRREATFAVRFLGARSDLHAAALAPEQARVTYFRPNRRIVAPTYERVAYRGVYPGIDVVYSGNRRRLEEDWIVHPGASVAPVRLALDGVHTVTRRPDGTLSLSFGSLGATESRPHAFQTIGGVHRSVHARWIVRGRTLTFAVGSYDRSQPLVIDPTIAASVDIGGSALDDAFDVEQGADGQIYVAGSTMSPDFPLNRAGFVSRGANFDAVVLILSTGLATEATLQFGGSGDEEGEEIAPGKNGSFLVSGITNSPNFPTRNAADATYGGGNCGSNACFDAFAMSFTDPSTLAWSTYVGGDGNDFPTALVGTPSAAYLVGFTNSFAFGTATGPGGGNDAFLAVLTPTGAFDHVLRFGGQGADAAYGVDVLGSTVVVAGGTTSSSLLGAGTRTSNRNPFLLRSTDGGRTFAQRIYTGTLNSSFDDVFLNPDGSVYGGFDGFFPGGSFPGCYPSACQPAGIVQLDAHDEVNRVVARMPPGGTGFFGITDLDPFRTSSGLVYGLAASVDSAASIFANSYDGLAWVFRAGCGDACPAFAGQAAVGDGSDATGVAADAADGAIFIAGQSQSPSVGGDVHVAKVTDLGLSPPCECRTLSTSTARYADTGTQATFDVHWLLTCAPGGGDCRGRIEVVPPAGTDIKIQNQKAGVNCILTCSPTQVSTTSGSFTVVATSKHSLARNKRRGKTFKYRIEKWCVIGGVANQEPTSTLTVVYRRDGRLDRSRSDLNADGRPDGSKKD